MKICDLELKITKRPLLENFSQRYFCKNSAHTPYFKFSNKFSRKLNNQKSEKLCPLVKPALEISNNLGDWALWRTWCFIAEATLALFSAQQTDHVRTEAGLGIGVAGSLIKSYAKAASRKLVSMKRLIY